MINIAYIIPSLDIGGSEKKVIDLVKGIDRNKFNPIIITITKLGSQNEFVKNLNIPVLCVNKKSKYDLKVIKRIAIVLKDFSIDIVHVFTSTGKLWGRLGAIKAKTKYIISTEESLFRNTFIDRFLERKLSSKTNLIIANSYASMVSASKYTKIKSNKYKVIHNGIDLDPFINANNLNILNKGQDEFIIICVARLDPRKGINLLIDSFKNICKNINTRLVIVGDGVQEKELKSQVNSLSLDEKVQFLGNRNDVFNLLKEADLFILPSLEEGFGNSIIEAMASGVCVIASNVGGIPEIIEHGVNGFMFNKGDTLDLEIIIKKVLNDDQLRTKIIKNAYESINKFSSKEMIKNHQDIYNNLMEGK